MLVLVLVLGLAPAAPSTAVLDGTAADSRHPATSATRKTPDKTQHRIRFATTVRTRGRGVRSISP